MHQLLSQTPNWRDQDLTAWAGGPPAANGSVLTSFVDAFGEHVCYIGTDNHVHKLMTPPGAPWQDNDLTRIAGGSQTANGTGLTSFVDGFGEHVCYIDAAGYVHQLITIGGGMGGPKSNVRDSVAKPAEPIAL